MADAARETRWVLLAQTGDLEAFDNLLKSIQEPIYRYIFHIVGKQHLAEDILQEVFIRVYKKLRYLRNPELFRAWVYRMASREAFRHLKREGEWSDQIRDEQVMEAIPDPRMADRFDSEMAECLPRLLENISPASRAVIVLHYIDELSIDEIAAVLEVS